ncbi:MAG: hypothetical protein LBJ08_02615, partial [Bifidobacteriaceae bacterium]|nr:hypothetical protein [Bifidobacteriaceae bacterium]
MKTVRLGAVALAAAAAFGLAGCSNEPASDYGDATVVDDSQVLSSADNAAVLECAQQFGIHANADRVVVTMIDLPTRDAEVARMAEEIVAGDPRENQLVLVQNVQTRYVWVQLNGSIMDRIGKSEARSLPGSHADDFRAGARQGICRTLNDARSYFDGVKRISQAGWAAGVGVPLLGVGLFLFFLFRSYNLKTRKQKYDLNLAKLEHLDGEDVFVRRYVTRTSTESSHGG